MRHTTHLTAIALAVAGSALACKKTDTPAPASGTLAAATAATSAAASPPATTPAAAAIPATGALTPLKPGTSPDFAKLAEERRAEIAKLVAELPEQSEGADSAEAAARTFAQAASKKDDAAIKKLLLSTHDLKSFVAPDKLERTKGRVAAVLYKLRKATFAGDLEIVGFKPGQTKQFKQGERGFSGDVTVMLRSQLEVKMAGKPSTLRFKSIVKMGARWKVAEM